MQHFGEPASTGPRSADIAATAGVSLGLVRHHFGSKEALRDACDAYLVKMVRRLNDQVRADGHESGVNYVAAGPCRDQAVPALPGPGPGRGVPAEAAVRRDGRHGEEWLAEADRRAPSDPPASTAGPGGGGHRDGAGRPGDARADLPRAGRRHLLSPRATGCCRRALIDIYSHPLMSLEHADPGAGRPRQRLSTTPPPAPHLTRRRTTMTDAISRRRDWSRRSAATRALDGLDLTVRTGEVHGFLGPNGAGKSTTIRVLLGLLRADAGAVRLLGGDPWARRGRLHRRLAYVPGDVTLWPNLTGGEVIDLLGRLRGGARRRRRRRAARAVRARPDASRAAPTPRATGRRSRWSPRSPPTWSCSSWTSPPRGWTR